MKTGEAAKLLGVDSNTVRNWIAHPDLEKHFSAGAKAEHGSTHRVLNESDILILNTIRHLRADGIAEWNEIAEKIDSGYREQEFPQNAITADLRTIPVPQAEQAAKYLATVAERDSALTRIDQLEGLIAQKESEIKELQEKRLEDNQEIGRLRGVNQMMEKDVARLKEEIKRLRDMLNEKGQ